MTTPLPSSEYPDPVVVIQSLDDPWLSPPWGGSFSKLDPDIIDPTDVFQEDATSSG
jgi:hypothetical protein